MFLSPEVVGHSELDTVTARVARRLPAGARRSYSGGASSKPTRA